MPRYDAKFTHVGSRLEQAVAERERLRGFNGVLVKALKPLALSDEENPPPGVQVEHWREAVLAARAAIAATRPAEQGAA